MHTGLKCAALLLLIAPLGCRSQGELDLAERDMRLQENRIYKLQEYVQQYQHMLEDCQAENDALRKQIADSGRTPDTGSSGKPRTLRELMNSNNNPGADSAPSAPDFTLPVTPSIDLGTEFDPTSGAPVDKPATKSEPDENSIPDPPNFIPDPPAGANPDLPGARGELPEPDDLSPPSAGGAAHQQATQLAIRAVGQVRGNSTMPGGLLIVIEPRSAHGGLARAPSGAKMSLMIVSAVGEESQGRWDYSAEQTSSAYRSGFGADSGWRFVVPFNKPANPIEKLKLYARLALPDGTKLISEREFDADAGASLEELHSGDAGWLRSNRPIAALANKIGREARMALNGPQPRTRTTGPVGSSSGTSSQGGNTAPAWQPQPAGSPQVSTGAPSSPSGGTAPAFSPSTAPAWNLTQIPTAPAENKAPAAPEAGTAPAGPVAPAGPAAETATRPAWSPYR